MEKIYLSKTLLKLAGVGDAFPTPPGPATGGLGFNYRDGQIQHSVTNGSPLSDVSSALRCPGPKSRIWAT